MLAWGLPVFLVEAFLLLLLVVSTVVGHGEPMLLLAAVAHLGPFAILLRDDLHVPALFAHAGDAVAFCAFVVLPLLTVPVFLLWRTKLGVAVSAVGTLLWFPSWFALFVLGRSA